MNLKLLFSEGGRSGTWSVSALRIGIYQYKSQIVIFQWVDLPPGLHELSEKESISMNIKLLFWVADLPPCKKW